ncbi:PAS domain-containing protein [Ancylobacter amanitiformis]|uniref:histidine kinase n=1 Tax=Ancylobacter amanitiformis TaxID=217069 RepID=A0ABU0LTP6_9HYPH|nr:PAS domain-containing protein [Ancylobacter amanitiformis]MDQ0512081.1 PAS domain S-box-containing protein [Ancylobacter amanitiformis]
MAISRPVCLALAVLACAAGMVAGWRLYLPLGLAPVVAVLFLRVASQWLLPLLGVATAGLAVSLLATNEGEGSLPDEGMNYGGCFALVLSLGGVLAAHRMLGMARAAPDRASRTLTEEAAPGEPAGAPLLHPDDRLASTLASARAFWTGVPQVMRYRQRQPDGSYRWFRTRSVPSYEAVVEISDLETVREEPMTHSPTFASPTADTVQAARTVEDLFGNGWAFDAAGAWIYLPLFAQTTLGLTPDDLNASLRDGDISWKLLLHPDEYEAVAIRWRHSLETGAPFRAEFRIRRANGVYAWAKTAAKPFLDTEGHIAGWFGTSIDIDLPKKTEAALRAKEFQLRQLIEAVPTMIWSTTASGTPTYANQRFIDTTGASLADITAPDGSASLSVIHPEDRQAARDAFGRSMLQGIPYAATYRQLRADGSYRWTATRAEPLRDEAGVIHQWYGVSVDIHERVVAEMSLRESEHAHRQLVETLPALIYCATPEGKPTYRSEKLRDYLGFGLTDKDDAERTRLENTLDAIIHPDDLAAVKERYAHALSTGEPYQMKHRLRRFDGVYRWVETRAAAMRNAEGTIVQWNGICLEIEDQVRAQEDLRLAQDNLARASQAASLAELSASIAHEVNQPLAAIVANSHTCLRWLRAEPPNHPRAMITAERIIRDSNAAADVVSRIRALFKQSVQPRTSTALPSVIGEARRLLTEEATRRRIRLHVDIEDGLPRVVFDRVQLQQVLINLLRNAMEAMEAAEGDKVVGIRVHRAEGDVQVRVSDLGAGVAFPDRIFEPFFTTKESGMGMGLAICRSIVESHGGRLWIESNEPRGAIFVFTLPVETDVAA